MQSSGRSEKTVAVAFLARGADQGWRYSFKRFLSSYKQYEAGYKHNLYIIFKGFANASELNEAIHVFDSIKHTPVLLEDDSFDIGAYIELANQITEEVVCFFNTATELLMNNWLKILLVNLLLPNVGLVGASASYESNRGLNPLFPRFPNPHIRSNAFMIKRDTFCNITNMFKIENKFDALLCESGPMSITRQIRLKGLEALVVGRNGRGYGTEWWPTSGTFRQGNQLNLLIADNQTRAFSGLPWNAKREAMKRTWGKII